MKLLGVAVQKLSRLTAYLSHHPMPFPFVSDEHREVVRTYGVYVAFNFESFRIARPATFVIDAGGVIRFIHVGRHQFDRPRPQAVWQIVDSLERGTPAGKPRREPEPAVKGGSSPG